MPIALTKQTAASVTTPPSGKVTVFADSVTGEPYYKDSVGTSTSLKGAAGANGTNGAAGGVTSPVTTSTSSSGVLNLDCSLVTN